MFMWMRTMALQARAATEASIATLQAYYAQVEKLQGIFPIHPDGVRVAFTWHDAFRCVGVGLLAPGVWHVHTHTYTLTHTHTHTHAHPHTETQCVEKGRQA